eukprot:3128356-Rhodomonas_salina.1
MVLRRVRLSPTAGIVRAGTVRDLKKCYGVRCTETGGATVWRYSLICTESGYAGTDDAREHVGEGSQGQGGTLDPRP